MQPDQPLLTIAIQTYNRSKYLAQMLNILAAHFAGESRIDLVGSSPYFLGRYWSIISVAVESFIGQGIVGLFIGTYIFRIKRRAWHTPIPQFSVVLDTEQA